jgi:hypothetical protein
MSEDLIPYSPQWYEARSNESKSFNFKRFKDVADFYETEEIIEMLDAMRPDLLLVTMTYVENKKKARKQELIDLLKHKWTYLETGEKVNMTDFLDYVEFRGGLKSFIAKIHNDSFSMLYIIKTIQMIKNEYNILESKR